MIGYLVILLGFGILAWGMALRGQTGAYVVFGLGCLFAVFLNEKRRCKLLKELFGSGFRKLRLLENAIVIAPFVLILIIGGYFLLAGLSLVGALLLAYLPAWGGLSYVIPTPFGRWPYEFPSGFRLVFPGFIGAYILFAIGLWVGNINLSAFAIAALYLICIQFYSRPEPVYYVWIQRSGPTDFLLKKALDIAVCSTMLSILPAIILMYLSPGDWWLVLLILIGGPLLVIAAMLAKYAYYPHEVNIAAALGIGFCIFVPILLPIAVLIFFLKARENTRRFLA